MSRSLNEDSNMGLTVRNIQTLILELKRLTDQEWVCPSVEYGGRKNTGNCADDNLGTHLWKSSFGENSKNQSVNTDLRRVQGQLFQIFINELLQSPHN